jgi:hypothetical protein
VTHAGSASGCEWSRILSSSAAPLGSVLHAKGTFDGAMDS